MRYVEAQNRFARAIPNQAKNIRKEVREIEEKLVQTIDVICDCYPRD